MREPAQLCGELPDLQNYHAALRDFQGRCEMRIGEIRIYKGRRLEERCERWPIREAEKYALEYARMIARFDCPRGTKIDASNSLNIRVGQYRVRVLNAGNF